MSSPTLPKVMQYFVTQGAPVSEAEGVRFAAIGSGPRRIITWPTSLLPQPPEDFDWDSVTPYDPVPQGVTKRQLRLALLDDGHSPSDVEALILAAFPEGSIEQAKALVEWQDALSYERGHPLVLTLAPALGYDTGDKIDEVYRRAATYS